MQTKMLELQEKFDFEKKSLLEQIESLTKLVKNRDEQNAALDEEIEEKNQVNLKLITDIENYEQKIRNLQQELANKTSEISKATESVQKSQKLEKTLADLEKQVQVEKADFEEKLQRGRQEIVAIQQKFQIDHENLKEENEALSSQLAEKSTAHIQEALRNPYIY